MRTRHTILTAVLVVVAATLGAAVSRVAAGEPAAATDQPPAPRVVMTGMTPAERRATGETLSLFAQAGLALPSLEIRRHHDAEPCDGYEGLHRRHNAHSVIDICTATSGGYEQRMILHELGHAWTEHFLTDANKQAFQDLRGWTYWLDYRHADWEDNGAEQAAEIIAWALSEDPTPVIRIRPNGCEDLHDGYVALTGREPLHGHTQRCRTSAYSANRL
jgi:hypothetical protein